MFEGIKLPIGIPQVIETTFEFIGMFGHYILIGLVVILSPLITKLWYKVLFLVKYSKLKRQLGLTGGKLERQDKDGNFI